jgi:hypothetical protein
MVGVYPFGAALDAAGNIYIGDEHVSAVGQWDAKDGLKLSFASIPVGGKSAEQSATLVNIGNANLNFASISLGSNANFAIGDFRK